MKVTKVSTNKAAYVHLLDDTAACHDIDSSGSASEHELGDLVRACGYPGLTSYLNDANGWGRTVGEVAELLLSDSVYEVETYDNDGEAFASVEHVESGTGMDIYADGTELDWQDNNGLAANNPAEIVDAARAAAREVLSK